MKVIDIPQWIKGSMDPYFTNYILTEARYPSPMQKELRLINYQDELPGCENGEPTGYNDPSSDDGQLLIDFNLTTFIINQ
jgi:hypothetical protein